VQASAATPDPWRADADLWNSDSTLRRQAFVSEMKLLLRPLRGTVLLLAFTLWSLAKASPALNILLVCHEGVFRDFEHAMEGGFS